MSSEPNFLVDEKTISDVLEQLQINFGGIFEQFHKPERAMEIAKFYAQFCVLQQQNTDVENLVHALQVHHFEKAKEFSEESSARVQRFDTSIAAATEVGYGNTMLLMKEVLLESIKERFDAILARKAELDGYQEKIQQNKEILKEIQNDIQLIIFTNSNKDGE